MISLLVSIYFILLSFGSSIEAKNEKLDFIEALGESCGNKDFYQYNVMMYIYQHNNGYRFDFKLYLILEFNISCRMDIPDYNYLEKFVIQDLKDSVNLETSIDFDVTEITEDWKLVNYTKDLKIGEMVLCPDQCKTVPEPATLSFKRGTISFWTKFGFILTVRVGDAPPTINEIQLDTVSTELTIVLISAWTLLIGACYILILYSLRN